MHLLCSSMAALIGWAVTVPEVQVNQSCSLNWEPHQSHTNMLFSACLLVRPLSGNHLFQFLPLRHAFDWNNCILSSSD